VLNVYRQPADSEIGFRVFRGFELLFPFAQLAIWRGFVLVLGFMNRFEDEGRERGRGGLLAMFEISYFLFA